MKKQVFTILLSLAALTSWAQESRTAYNFLRLPISAHAAALGGENITISDDDATLVFNNPALLQNITDKTLNLNMMTYMQGTVTASASFARAWGERASWGISGRYMDYGQMKETDITGEETGSFGARDVAIGGTISYGLTNSISGGVTAKLAASYMGQYNSLAVLVDLGLNYRNDDSDLSISAVAKNLGGQVDAFEDDFERMPLDLQLGITKRLLNSPLRLSFTLTRLNDWEYNLGKHINVGADLLLGEQFYVAAGYNFLRASEMKISSGDGSSSHGAGLSLGGGLQLERLKLHVAYGKYHVSASSLLINISYSL
ncbi:type IX secretion system protein PorQ [Prevotella sp. E13-27]|uniref:type IX secretion system protein PorQ n=1 Tax=Prevotella sp. E13-27 TaxID=2938122 RepID=UPI00200A3474|nr:type IX secretion system protein PorQ [Prevotella sp. E13-27]MBQ7663202.1 type IX secretion system protein PorQ [Prevotella sp.]MCK8621110.1 type IX secretion system protein PorQ [Prevotella sp. E13-27]